jgi:hypothetical protein
MRTRTGRLTSLSRARTRGSSDSAVWNRPKVAFTSTCPRCGRERLQHGYDRRTLFILLNTGRSINAYCGFCNVCWPIGESERQALSS